MPCLFRNAHHPGHWTKAASGGLNPDPTIRVREACSHLLGSTAAPSWCLHTHLLFAPSWRTVVHIASSAYFNGLEPSGPSMARDDFVGSSAIETAGTS